MNQTSSDITTRESRLPSWSLALTLAMLAAFLVMITRRAWVGDDAYITFRTIDNLTNGYALTWNPGERVQAYTHPLWMFLLSVFYLVSGEIFYTSIAVSLLVSLGAAALVSLGAARSRLTGALALMVLGLSNAFVDYSTSGLENPLTHLLLAVFLVIYIRGTMTPRRMFWLSAVASLAAVNRLDTILIYLPALVVALFDLPGWKRGLLPGMLGQVPLLLWELFSLVYYGFPFPNTAYAKLNNGVAAGDLLAQGLRYLDFSWDHDPLTLVMIGVGLAVAAAERQRRTAAVAAGAVLYIAYVVKIGGDFMAGRFLTAPLLCAAVLIAAAPIDHWFKRTALRYGAAAALALAAIVIAAAAPLPAWSIHPSANYSLSDERRVNDERAWYFADMGLLTRTPAQPFPTSQGKTGGLAALAESQKDYYVIPVNNIGLYGYYAGPKVYIIDQYALADPLLARLPAERETNFYVGHFHRRVPEGYLSSIYTGKNLIEDARVAEYYDYLRLIVRGPLFSPERWAAIWKMNTGQLNHLVDLDSYRYPDMVILSDEHAQKPDGEWTFADSGLEIDLCGCGALTAVELDLSGPARYEFVFYKGDEILERVRAGSLTAGEMQQITVPSPSRWGIDRVRIFPLRGSSLKEYQLTGFRILE